MVKAPLSKLQLLVAMELEAPVALWHQDAGAPPAVDATVCVSPSPQAPAVLVTTQREVLELDSQSRKCLNHWAFRAAGKSAGQALALAAARSPVSRVLFGVRGSRGKAQGQAIVSWRDEDKDAGKWRRQPLPTTAPAFALLVHTQLALEALVVFQDGSFAAYDDELQLQLETEADEGGAEVVWAALHSDNPQNDKGRLLLSLVVKKTSHYELVVYHIVPRQSGKRGKQILTSGTMTSSLLLRHQIAFPDGNDTDTVSACTFINETFSYSIIWSSGAWESLSIGVRNATSARFSLVFKAAETVATIATPTANKKRKVASGAATASAAFTACSLAKMSFLIVGSSQKPGELASWDAKFAVNVSTTSIDTTTEESAEASIKPSATGKLLSVRPAPQGEFVIAVFERGVFLVNAKNKTSSLSSVLGAGAKAASTQSVPQMPATLTPEWWRDVSKDDEPKVIKDADTWKVSVCETAASAKEQHLVGDLADPKVTGTTAKFLSKYKEAKANAGEKELPFRVVMAVAQRSVESPELGLWAPLREVISSKRLSARAVPGLLPMLAHHNQLDLLQLALSDLTDIDERAIVRLLRYFIKLNARQTGSKVTPTKAKKRKAASSKTDTDASSENVERFIVTLLSLPTNSVFLHHAVREFQLYEALYLLTVCKKYAFATSLLDTKESEDKTEITPSFADFAKDQAVQSPPSEHLCAWIAALIDAHLTSLVLAAGSNKTIAADLERLGAVVDAQLRSCDRIESVCTVLSNFFRGRVKLPRAHGVPDYSVEELLI